MTDAANAAQIDYWNQQVGPTWVQFQAQLDRQLHTLGLAAIAALAPQPGEAVLDIGCGCGETTLQLAARVGTVGAVTGVDISRPMLEVARARPVSSGSAPPRFVEADAQTGDLGAGVFNAVFSRFGVMFFADPPAAFANIRRALKPSGRLTFICWRPFEQNPWMRDPAMAAAAFLPPPAPMDPTAPGPFAFAGADRVRGVLERGGFADITITPHDAMIGGGDVEQTLQLAFRVGPLGAALREHPDKADAVADAVRAVLTTHLTPQGVLMPAATWIVRATAG